METRRYRALHRYTYGLALVSLVQLARQSPRPPFQFGPMHIHTLVLNGLTVTGTDLSSVAETLAKVPGLIEVPA